MGFLNRLERKPPRSSHIGDYDAFWFDLDNDMLQGCSHRKRKL